jgi:hypothetical protein
MSTSSAAMIAVACSISDRRTRTARAASRCLASAPGFEAAQLAKARRTEAMTAGVIPTRRTLSPGHAMDLGARQQTCTANGEERRLSRHRGHAVLPQQTRDAGLSKTTRRNWPDPAEPVMSDSLARHGRLADSHLISHRKMRSVFAPPGGGA